MGCFYCDEHHEGREAIMFKVGDMKAGTLYLFKDQAHKGRCALALKSHKKELCECDEQERNDYCADLAAASGAIKKLWGCTKINLGSFGDSNPHLHFHIVPKYEGGFEFGGSQSGAGYPEGRGVQENDRGSPEGAWPLILWLHKSQTASNFTVRCCFLSYMILAHCGNVRYNVQ